MISIDHYGNIIKLVKDGNIKLSIYGKNKKIYKAVFYEIEDNCGYQNAKCIYDSDILRSGWFCSETLDYKADTYPNKILISIRSEKGLFIDIVYDKIKDKFYRINETKDEEILNNIIRPPIVIVGSPGGGTSYIAKLLKYRGLYCGTDSGNMSLRKNHEPITFTSFNDLIRFYDGEYELWYTEEELQRKQERIKKTPFLYSLLFKNHMKYKFKNFWGNAPFDSIWGWKDPLCSITLPIWHNIFPQARLMIVTRTQEKLSKSMVDIEGNWFRKAPDYVLRYYLKPDISNFSQDDVFYCDFHKVVKDMNSMNEMLSWIGLETLDSKDEYINFLKETGYEG